MYIHIYIYIYTRGPSCKMHEEEASRRKYQKNLGSIWGSISFGKPFGGLGDALGSLWGAFEKPWGCLWGAFGMPLGALGDALGGLWDAFGVPGGRLGGVTIGEREIRGKEEQGGRQGEAFQGGFVDRAMLFEGPMSIQGTPPGGENSEAP